MNKKQMGIILTLLILIACAGVLSVKMNGKIDDPTGSIPSAISFNKEAKETTDKNDYFYEAKSIKDQQDAKYKEELKAVINDKNSTAKDKEEASKKIKDIDSAKNNETRIELGVKSKGFEDVVCLIEGNKKARVIVKAKEALTEKQNIQIQEVVLNVSKLKDVIIETK
ncbi:stage III sporulation protein AH [Clostridium cavendishii DSM 21758]|uniref:Stage III sporulation protein AH n=1 Tax=Clostridium cavendishii DSM 21758 TaxID=1121302 RepID=A0A1M6KKF4_9CLOT|nr:SpoIIIAH-like family protein [Clostridium cavendishii]SHJ59452.1 stage III sporulation protein AH [Clostridium cavendishii DSM 21758]